MQLLTDYQEVRNVQLAGGARMSLNTESAARKGVRLQVRVQERMQCLAMGAMPRSINVILTEELADSCRPGGVSQLCSLLNG